MKIGNGKRAWTPEEDAALRAKYKEGLTLAEIGAQINRPKGSVCTRADQLGLVRPKKEQCDSRIGTIIRPRPGVLIHYAKVTTK
jgi:hypothetical protein